MPPLTPVTTPDATVATPVDPELQTPPPVASVRFVVAPTHSVGVPLTVPAMANGLTVTTTLVLKVPQMLVTIYDMITVPDETPVTIPVDEPTVAIPVAPELHTPPLVASVSALVAPTQTVAVPVIDATEIGLTVAISVADAVQ